MYAWRNFSLITKCMYGVYSFIQFRDIQRIDRFREVPKIGLFCDLLWADPIQNEKGHTDKIIVMNDSRGCSYYFGY